MIRNATTSDMKSLSVCLNQLLEDGFKENFKVTGNGIQSIETNRIYAPAQIHVVDFYRFEGASDPDDNSILYAIQTQDGAKGTLADAYGAYADSRIDDFMKAVEDIHKKVPL